jgi:hypothetical protein
MRPGSPIRAALRAVPPASLEPLAGVPGINYANNMVEFEAKDFGAAYDGVVALINVARQSYPQVLTEMIRSRPDGAKMLLEYSDRLFRRWEDMESGRWSPPAPVAPPAGKRYHGPN